MTIDLKIPLSKTLIQPGDMKKAKPLVGFDLGPDLFHVVLFPETEGGSIGIIKEGENFCARLTLDSLAAFWEQAKAEHVEGKT